MVHFDSESSEFNFFSEDFSQLDQRKPVTKTSSLVHKPRKILLEPPAVVKQRALQNDAGTTGDAGNASTNTAKNIGTDPTTLIFWLCIFNFRRRRLV